jgi:hypothetical protein
METYKHFKEVKKFVCSRTLRNCSTIYKVLREKGINNVIFDFEYFLVIKKTKGHDKCIKFRSYSNLIAYVGITPICSELIYSIYLLGKDDCSIYAGRKNIWSFSKKHLRELIHIIFTNAYNNIKKDFSSGSIYKVREDLLDKEIDLLAVGRAKQYCREFRIKILAYGLYPKVKLRDIDLEFFCKGYFNSLYLNRTLNFIDNAWRYI